VGPIILTTVRYLSEIAHSTCVVIATCPVLSDPKAAVDKIQIFTLARPARILFLEYCIDKCKIFTLTVTIEKLLIPRRMSKIASVRIARVELRQECDNHRQASQISKIDFYPRGLQLCDLL